MSMRRYATVVTTSCRMLLLCGVSRGVLPARSAPDVTHLYTEYAADQIVLSGDIGGPAAPASHGTVRVRTTLVPRIPGIVSAEEAEYRISQSRIRVTLPFVRPPRPVQFAVSFVLPSNPDREFRAAGQLPLAHSGQHTTPVRGGNAVRVEGDDGYARHTAWNYICDGKLTASMRENQWPLIIGAVAVLLLVECIFWRFYGALSGTAAAPDRPTRAGWITRSRRRLFEASARNHELPVVASGQAWGFRPGAPAFQARGSRTSLDSVLPRTGASPDRTGRDGAASSVAGQDAAPSLAGRAKP